MSIDYMVPTPIIKLGDYNSNQLWIKREDLIPFSFGGNKARKALLFFEEINNNNCDSVVTYGSSSSNHCRVISNLCKRYNLPCYIISPLEASEETYNSRMIEMFGAEVTTVPVCEVHDTIQNKIGELQARGLKPYFIEGGGHGNLGTEAYVQCYEEIKEYQRQTSVKFDYIFFASGTGTTQAGLVCGKINNKDDTKIIGISIARKNPRGRNIVVESIKSYFNGKVDMRIIDDSTVFIDDYANAYGVENAQESEIIKSVLEQHGIPLDSTYTGKAFMGMDSVSVK